MGAQLLVTCYGADPTGRQDSAPALRAALQENATLELGSGTYRIDSTVAIPSGRAITGDGASLVLSQPTNLLTLAYPSTGVVLGGFGLKAKPGLAAGTLFRVDGGPVTDFTMSGLTFSAPEINDNAISWKAYPDTPTNDLLIEGCTFLDIGRAAIEMGFAASQTVPAMVGVRLLNNTIRRTGLVVTDFGPGISIAGLQKDVEIAGNTFEDSTYAHIEFGGQDGMTITGNVFSGRSGGGLIRDNPYIPGKRTLIANNVSASDSDGNLIFWSASGAEVRDNDLVLGGIYLKGVNDMVFKGNTFRMSTHDAMMFDGAGRNSFAGNLLDHKRGPPGGILARFYDVATTGNTVAGNTVFLATSGLLSTQENGAAGNTLEQP